MWCAIERVSATFVAVALLLTGCAITPHTEPPSPVQRPRISPPPQPDGSLRLIVYRPQALVGMLGKPTVLINGQRLVNSSNESFLQPGSVFIVDAPAERAEVAWIQGRQTEPGSEVLIFNKLPAATRYLRWTLKPTYGFLEQVPESVALGELGPLLYSGYRNMLAKQ